MQESIDDIVDVKLGEFQLQVFVVEQLTTIVLQIVVSQPLHLFFKYKQTV
jgi:hypothetical protein